jgi:H+/Cl- antiporter ClcA
MSIESSVGMGIWEIGLFLLLGVLIGVIGRFVHQRIAKGPVHKTGFNIGAPDRIVRFAFAGILLVWGVQTSSPGLLIGAGFTFYESFFKWCGFYALIGKNTCPIK